MTVSSNPIIAVTATLHRHRHGSRRCARPQPTVAMSPATDEPTTPPSPRPRRADRPLTAAARAVITCRGAANDACSVHVFTHTPSPDTDQIVCATAPSPRSPQLACRQRHPPPILRPPTRPTPRAADPRPQTVLDLEHPTHLRRRAPTTTRTPTSAKPHCTPTTVTHQGPPESWTVEQSRDSPRPSPHRRRPHHTQLPASTRRALCPGGSRCIR